MKTFLITANLPAILERSVRLQVRQEYYPSESDFGLGLILWDIYSRQRHETTGPLMGLPRWAVENAAYALAKELGIVDTDARAQKPYRFTVRVPQPLRAPVKIRMKEERYRSASAYITGLVFFSLQVRPPNPKKVAHHKCAALLREPEWVREEAFKQFAKDFGKADRKWPKPR